MGVLLRGSRNETTLGISIRKELNTGTRNVCHEQKD